MAAEGSLPQGFDYHVVPANEAPMCSTFMNNERQCGDTRFGEPAPAEARPGVGKLSDSMFTIVLIAGPARWYWSGGLFDDQKQAFLACFEHF
jgi:hypothetical protein